MKFNIPYKYRNAKGIYKITNNINKQVYIGRTNNFYKRFYDHCQSFKNGTCNSKFYSFIKIHPTVEFKFSLVEITDDIANKEEKYISIYNSVNNGFNILYKDDDVFNLPNWSLNIKKRQKHYKNIKIENQTYETLKSGYVRLNNGNLLKKPIIAKKLIETLIVPKRKSEKDYKKRENYNNELDKVINNTVEKMKLRLKLMF